MSEKMMAASSAKRRRGWSVTSHASSGVLASARKLPALRRVSLYSGRERPACRMIHTGVYGVGSRINARSNVSLCMAAIISGEAAVEENADRPGIAGMQVEVVMAETLELHALHRAAPHPRELVRVVRADQR